MWFSLIVLYLKLSKPKIQKFGVWSRLESLAVEVQKAVESDVTKFPELVGLYLSTALNIPKKLTKKLKWSDTISLYYLALTVNTPNKIPLLTSDNKKEKPVGWDYSGRNWNYWSHLFALNYGWSLEYIAGLDVNTALAHIQEILTDQQLEHEFVWSTTEIAYPYNSNTKQSKFSPLERPYWMAEKAQPIRKVKILRSMLPIGQVHDSSGLGLAKYIQEEAESENIKPGTDVQAVLVSETIPE
jgi:hypothetical protein